ncbi:23S rRNA (adenine(2503)-C(2))-methyltransferase RlmN [Haloglycomyces albus]|uniref:23S rRNA (adenine(2503)-C(2))-methyltransferase RlmN n=1 Tax=Haloglycomyces albus TaxID=526067 RepID=UPI00046CF945|nr:23S rRNA (adenine(2503)-C(2))-methyltransferase RlmN [Haloglycomyces albus]
MTPDSTDTLALETYRRSIDGTIKYLWSLHDGQTVESVYLPLANRGAKGPSLCISSQVGCAVRCTFCATGENGLVRNLTCDEIVAQVETTLDHLGSIPEAFDVSFMGMGEPLHNLHAVTNAIRKLYANYSGNSDIHFSLSTIGITKRIYKLADFEHPVALQVSLHGPTDQIRESLIPERSRGSISDLFNAIRHYAIKRDTMVNLNYLLFDNLNDTPECAAQLINLLADKPHVRLKLSHYNPIEGNDLNPASSVRKRRFMDLCAQRGLHVFDWESMGVDISGGCGQLRSSSYDDLTA